MSEDTPTFDLTSDPAKDETPSEPAPEANDDQTVTDESQAEGEVKSDPLVDSLESSSAVDTDEETPAKTELYYPTHLDPARQVSPTGIYLDDVQRIEAEKVRARIEGREPDLENPPAVQGTPLQTAAAINHSLSTLSTHGVEPDVVL